MRITPEDERNGIPEKWDPGPSSGTLRWDSKVGPWDGTLQWDPKVGLQHKCFPVNIVKCFVLCLNLGSHR